MSGESAIVYWRLGRRAELPPEKDDASWLAPSELARAADMLPKRRADFRLGRFVAKQALRSLLGPAAPGPAAIDIGATPDGAPRCSVLAENLPEEISLSLSHREGKALCTLWRGHHAVGCDLERIEPRSEAFVADFFLPAERALLDAAGRHAWLAAALIWSAKESCLKALRSGLRRDTRSIEILLPAPLAAPDPPGWKPLEAVDLESSGSPSEASFRGWWQAREGFVLTVLARGEALSLVEL